MVAKKGEQKREKQKSSELVKKNNKKEAAPKNDSANTPKASTFSKVDKAKEEEEKKNKDESEGLNFTIFLIFSLSEEMPAPSSSEPPPPNKEQKPITSKSRTASVFTGDSLDTSTPTARGSLFDIDGEKKVSAVLTALTELEKCKN